MAGVFQAKGGKVAIWTGAQDDAPFNSPLANINRVKFHSDLEYVAVTRLLYRTVVLPQIPTTGSGQGDPGVRVGAYDLGVHNEGRIPFLVAKITVGGVPVAFTGSVLVHNTQSTKNPDLFGRWLAIGADGSKIWLHEYSVQNGSKRTGLWTARPQQSFALEIGITNVSL